MGEPATLQYSFAVGLDEKTASLWSDTSQNLSTLVNCNFTHVGVLDKRLGMRYSAALSTATLLNSATIADSYLAPAQNPTALAGFGDVIFQNGWAWTVKGAYASYVGEMPTCSVTRRPLPVQGPIAPLVLDGVTSAIGTVRVAAWIQPASASTWTISAAYLDPTKSSGIFNLVPFTISASSGDVRLVALLNLNGTVALFFTVFVGGGAPTRTLECYTFDPTSANPTWTHQAGADLALFNGTLDTCLDVAPFNGDPNHGYIVLYLASGDATTLHWRYYQSFASVNTGTLAAGTTPGRNPVYIQADYGTDVVFAYTDNLSANLKLAWYSGDALFAAITTASTSMPTNLNFPLAVGVALTGICRMSPAWAQPAGFNSQVYVSFYGLDTTYFGNGGPEIPLTMGGIVTRSNVTTTTFTDFVMYPAGMMPVGKPCQPVDGLQNATAFVHVSQPCVLSHLVAFGGTENANSPRSLQNTLYLVDWRVGPSVSPLPTILATCAPRQVDAYMDRWTNWFPAQPHVPPCLSSDGKSILVPLVTAATGVSGVTQDIGAHWLATFAMTSPTTPTAVQVNQQTQLPGGVPSRIATGIGNDAPTLVEQGFVNYPEFLFALTGAAGSPNGSYSYAACYGRQDPATGNIERGAPVVMASPITLTNQQGVVYFSQLAWWANKNTNPQGYFVEIYRTVAGGSTYYCVARLYPKDFVASSSSVIWTYTDNATDAQIAQAEILYTTGGILDAVNPPAAAMHCAHRGRYAVVDETLRNVWFTQSEIAGEVLGFNENLISPFIEGGDLTAISSMDDKFIGWKASSIWIQYGDGPALTGQNSDWTTPQAVPTDVGCISAASLALIPDGTIFQSSKGFCLLSRGLEVEFIGKNMIDTVAAYPTCVSSVVVPYANQVRICMQDANNNQVVLAYDYLVKQWTKHTYANLDAPIAQLFIDVGQYAILTTKGTRYIESTSSYLDTDTANVTHFVSSTGKSANIRLDGPLGYMRAKTLAFYGISSDPAGLQIQIFANEGATPVKTATWTYAMHQGDTDKIQVRIPAAYSKCRSFQVQVTDLDDPSKSTGQGIGIGAIKLELEKLGDVYKRIPARLKA